MLPLMAASSVLNADSVLPYLAAAAEVHTPEPRYGREWSGSWARPFHLSTAMSRAEFVAISSDHHWGGVVSVFEHW
jgi:hypothetical protein